MSADDRTGIYSFGTSFVRSSGVPILAGLILFLRISASIPLAALPPGVEYLLRLVPGLTSAAPALVLLGTPSQVRPRPSAT